MAIVTKYQNEIKPGESTPLHDRARSQVGLYVMEGDIKEEVFDVKNGKAFIQELPTYSGAILPAQTSNWKETAPKK